MRLLYLIKIFIKNFDQMNKIQVFLLTSMCASNSFSSIATFAMLKSPLSEEFGFNQNFLGILDGLCQIGTMVASLWLVFVVIRKPKQFFYFVSWIQSIILLLMILGLFIPHKLVRGYFIVLMLLLGMTKSVAFIPGIALNQYFDWNNQKAWISIWGSFLWLGDPIVIFLYNLITSTFNWNWEVYVTIICFQIMVSAVLWNVFIEEIPPIQHGEEEKSLKQEVIHMLSEAKQILLQFRYSILLADCGIANALYNNILWFPYYFTALNFPNQAAVISILYISMSAVGSFSFEALMANHEKWSPLLAGVFLGVSVFIGVIMLHFSFQEQTASIMNLYMLLSAAQGFLTGGPACRLCQSDLVTATRGNSGDLYTLLVLAGTIRSIVNAICLYLTGSFLEKSKSVFNIRLLLVFFGLCSLIFSYSLSLMLPCEFILLGKIPKSNKLIVSPPHDRQFILLLISLIYAYVESYPYKLVKIGSSCYQIMRQNLKIREFDIQEMQHQSIISKKDITLQLLIFFPTSMQNDNFEYKIGGYKAYQIYSFLRNEKKQPQYMNKRYFQAEHESFPNQKFFIMVYERKLFHEESLLIHLNELKNIEPQEHAPFPIIKQILENAEVKIDSEVPENVIALVMKKSQEENFISFFDFAGENPLFNENSIKKYTTKILEIIQFMSSKGFSSHFSPQSVFIGEDSGTLQIYGYGDQEFYRLKDERKKHSELWKVAFFIFTCLKQYPPYTNSSPTQAYYRMLKKRDYDKFWKQNSRSRPELSKLCQNFINLLFDQTELATIEQIKAHVWLKQYEPITIQEIKLIQKKRKEQILKKREEIQKRIKQAAFKKQMNINVRSGGYKCCQNLLQEYEQEQQRQRAFKKGKVDEKRLDLLFIGEITDKSFAVANLFCILEAQKHGQRARVSKVDKSKQSLITFHLETQLFTDYLYQSDIKIELFLEGDILSIRLEQVYGTLYEAIWVKNYLKNLFVGV